ncbi:MAG: DUF1465 family protein [Kiloniellales bacterium]|nr:DUF1465 family protein [Kiloniellales bacterium]
MAFFDSTYEEALGLACELRDRIAAKGGEGRPEPEDYHARLYGSCECLRMTARLTQVIAWFLVQKAVHAGELSREEARAKHRRLGGQAVCNPDRELKDAGLPPVLADLQRRTGELYARVARLDSMMNG